MAILTNGNRHVLYVTRTNDDSLGVVDIDHEVQTQRINLSWIHLALPGGHFLTGNYPNVLAASHDGLRLYVAEGGINAVAILDTSDPFAPKLLGRIPTGWWPVALAISPDDKFLYSVNAKGIGEDINPATTQADPPSATGVESFEDSNLVFGTVQKVALDQIKSIETRIDDYNVVKIKSRKDSVVPIGGRQASKKIKYVIFIEQENKSFDSILGESNHLQPFASTKFHHPDGSAFSDTQYGPVTRNTRLLAETFATALNDYSDSEESDAGHQFCASGTATDYTVKNLIGKGGPRPSRQEVWALVSRLDTAEPDEDSRRLGALARLSMRADSLYRQAENGHSLNSDQYLHAQRELMHEAEVLVGEGKNDE